MRPFADFSLRTKLILLVSLLTGAIAVFLMLYFPARMDRQATTRIEHRASAIGALLTTALAQSTTTEQANRVLAALAGYAEAEYAIARRSNGSVLGDWNGARAQAFPTPLTAEPILHRDEHTVHVVQLFETSAHEPAFLTLGFSLNDLQNRKQDYQDKVSWAAMLIVVAGLIAAFAIGTVLIRPLRSMTDVALSIAEGDLSGAERELGGLENVRQMAQRASDIRERRADEVAVLRSSFARMLRSLRNTSSTLFDSTQILTQSVENLNTSAREQSQMITRQASALQETQVTAQEIKQTSLLAAQKADAVVQVAERADQVSRSGEVAIEHSLEGMNEIRARVEDIARKIGELSERARQIGGITQTVKDLADQSNMLALNAAIEAVRSGEHGKGFAVVAREIRSLADQSIQATDRVREILEDIGGAVRVAVSITEEGANKIEVGLAQVHTSGQNMRELSRIVKDNADAVRQIAAAVSQQNIGFTQIFTAVNDLSSMMDDTVRRLDGTQDAVASLKDVSERVAAVAQHYRL